MVGKGAPGISAINAWLDLVRVPPSGTWDRRRADQFALASEWIGPDPAPAKGEATAALIASYLRAFGPATPAEAADWAGLPIGAVKAALEWPRAAPLPRRGRRRARRPAASAAARSRHARAAAAAAGVGRDAARPRAPRPDPPRGAPLEGLQHEDAAVGPDVPRRRSGRGHLAFREGQGRSSSRSGGWTREHGASSTQEGERLAEFAA